MVNDDGSSSSDNASVFYVGGFALDVNQGA